MTQSNHTNKTQQSNLATTEDIHIKQDSRYTTYVKNSSPQVDKLNAIDYFKLAKSLTIYTFYICIIFFIGSFIFSFFGKEELSKNIISIIKDFLWPFLTLLIGYLFGKGIPSEDK